MFLMDADLVLFKMLKAELGSGIITSIVVPGSSNFFNFFSSDNSMIIPWSAIKCIGDDVILVEL